MAAVGGSLFDHLQRGGGDGVDAVHVLAEVLAAQASGGQKTKYHSWCEDKPQGREQSINHRSSCQTIGTPSKRPKGEDGDLCARTAESQDCGSAAP